MIIKSVILSLTLGILTGVRCAPFSHPSRVYDFDQRSVIPIAGFNFTVVTDEATPFDPSSCRRIQGINRWANLPVSPTPYPDPPMRSRSSTGGHTNDPSNSTAISPTLLPSNPGTAWADERSRSTSSTLPEVCEQVAAFRFTNKAGFVRTKPAWLDTSVNLQFWLIWDTDLPAIGTVWRSQGASQRYWRKVYTSPLGGETRAAVYLLGSGSDAYMAADLNLPEGAGGRGTSGEIALFSVHAPH